MKNGILLFIVLIILSSSGCKKDEANPVAPPASLKEFNETGNIGNSGGIVKVTNQNSMIAGAYVEIPQGAISSETQVSVIPPSSGYKLAFDTTAVGVEFLPSGLKFSVPIKIAVPYDPSVSDPYSLSIYYVSSDGKIEQLDVESVDTQNKVLIAYTDHFSTYYSSSERDNVRLKADLLNINGKIGARIEVYGNYLGNDVGLYGIPNEIVWALTNGIPNAGQAIENITSRPHSVFHVSLKEKALLIDPIIKTVKLYVKRYEDNIWSERIVVCDEQNNIVYEHPTYLSKKDQYWYRGVPLIFKFNDVQVNSSKKYYISCRWAITIHPDIFYLSLVTPQFTFNTKSGAKKLSEMQSFNRDADNNNVDDSYQANVTTNNDPNAPTSPSPANNAASVQVTSSLSWSCSDPDNDPLAYDIYLGTSNAPGIMKTNHSSTSYTHTANLLNNKTYYWYIIAKDGKGGSKTSPVWSFKTINSPTNLAPSKPQNVSPSNNQANLGNSLTLKWECSDPENDPVTYDVYFDKVNPPVTKVATQSAKSLSRNNLETSTTYYWRVNAKDNQNTTTGDVWRFMTKNSSQNLPPVQPHSPNPSDWSSDVSTATDLSWQCSDPENDPLTYDIYFGTEQDPPKVKSNNTSRSYNPGTLNQATQYYWKIQAKDSKGNISISPVWVFYTKGGAIPSVPTLSSPADGATGVGIPQTLSWNASTGAASYTLQISTSRLFGSYVYNQSDLRGTSQQVSGLSNSTTYYWRVNATNSYGTSGYSSVWSFTTTSGGGGGSPCVGVPTVTYEGKTYNTVQVGTQCWLKENLDIGVMITSTTSADSQRNNNIIEKYCYENNLANCNTYGGLYQWNEALHYSTTYGTTEGARGICPSGWHIPIAQELGDLERAVNQDGNALKAVGQGTGPGAGTNTSGFSALLTGFRHPAGGFQNISFRATFWASNFSVSSEAFSMRLNYYDSYFSGYDDNKNYGFSVRCVKD